MSKVIKWLLILLIFGLTVLLIYWFIKVNPLKLSVKDVREVFKQVFVYSFAACVAVFGYWWTQRQQNYRHDDELYEARWNKTLDLQLEALDKLSKMCTELRIDILRMSKWHIYQFVHDDVYMADNLRGIEGSILKMMSHTFFYLEDDDFYLIEVMTEITGSINDLEGYIDQVLPLPQDIESDVEVLITRAINGHFNKINRLSLLLDWEIGMLKRGKVTERYDLKEDDDNQWNSHPDSDSDSYNKWKFREYKSERTFLGLSHTNVILNQREVEEPREKQSNL
ncbi:hypothetical protein HJ177_20655 [Vibrio parahaemolyticus]|nr:hypothetical protein [Vibrio parahaemolyticus]